MRKDLLPATLFTKRLWLLLLLLGALTTARAQVARYTFAQSTAPYVPLTGGTVVATATPNVPPGPFSLSGTVHQLAPGTIPFAFTFNGAAYTGGYLASGGYFTFGAVAPLPRFTPKPGSAFFYDIDHPLSEPLGTGYDGAVALMAGDILARTDPGNLGELRYQTLGTAPNRVFVVQWSRMAVYLSVGGNLDFQLRLHETSNVIELAYGPCQSSRALDVQVGLRGYTPNDFNNRTGTWAASTAGASNTATLPLGPGLAPATGLVYTFTPPAPQPCPVPFSLAATPTGTQARLSWRAAAPSAGPYTVVYGLAGFNPANGGLGTLPNLTGTSVAISGLSPSTDYEFYVTQSCGGAGTSPVSNPPGRFRTTILNDEPADAVVLPVLAACQPVSSSTSGATRSAGNGYDPLVDCNGFSSTWADADVWFSFTTAASGPASTAVQITATGAPAQRVRLFRSANGSAGPFTQLFCIRASNGPTAFLATGLNPNTTYYVLVSNDGANSPTGPFTLCATIPPACSDPSGLLSSVTNSTATTAQLSFTPGSGASSYTVTLTPPGGATQTITATTTTAPVVLTFSGLAPATTYAGTLQATCTNGGQSSMLPFTAYTRPANDEPATAIALPIGASCQPVDGSNDNASGSARSAIGFANGYPAGCGAVRPYDVWYSFTTLASGPASSAVRIRVSGPGAGQVRVFAPTGTGTQLMQLACSAGSATAAAPLLDVTRLTPNTTYYVLVGNYSSSPVLGPFTICVTEPPTCGAPESLSIFNLQPTSAELSFFAGVPASTAGHRVTLTAQGASPVSFVYTGTNSIIPLTALQPGTYYTVTLQSDCGPGGLSLPATLAFRTPGPPANDQCSNAVTVACGQTRIHGMLTGATSTGDPAGTCGVPLGGPAVWYRLLGTGDDVTISTCSGFADDPDMQLLVYTGSCANLVCVGGNDDSNLCGLPRLPTYTFATTPGATYYILVADTQRPVFPAASGEFDLNVSCAPAASCPPPTALTVAGASAGATTVNWTPTSTASSYQVVWQPLVGSAPSVVATVAQPPATSPALLPNMSYQISVTAQCGAGPARSVAATTLFSTALVALNAAASLVELYPNPAHGTATLRVPTALRSVPVTGVLYNALGQAVRELVVTNGADTTTISLAGLPPGRYLLRLLTSQGALTKVLLVN